LKNYTASGEQPEKPTAASKEGVLTATGTSHHRADDAPQQPSVRPTRLTADLGGLCLVDGYRLRRADEVALRASVVQIWPM
jgi:hypothetical protein